MYWYEVGFSPKSAKICKAICYHACQTKSEVADAGDAVAPTPYNNSSFKNCKSRV